jgi:hypothetical protein
MTLRGQLRSRPSSPSTHQPKRACILRLQLLAGAQAAPAFLCITSPDIIIIYHRALHEQLFHCTRNWLGLLSWTRAPRIFSRVTRARETTLCSNLMPVIPSRRSVCAEQASRAKLGAERGVTPILISCSGMASCFYRVRTSVCSRRHVTAKGCTHTLSTQWFADTRKKPHHYRQQLRWPGSPMQLQCKTIKTR